MLIVAVLLGVGRLYKLTSVRTRPAAIEDDAAPGDATIG